MDKPTYADMRAWRDELQGEWGDGGNAESFTSAQERSVSTYFQRFAIHSPNGRHAVKTGSAPADADGAADSITPAKIQVKKRPRRDHQKYQEQADKLVLFGMGMLDDWRRVSDPLPQIAFDMVVRHVGVARVMFDRSRWPNRPKELTGEDADDWDAFHRARQPIILERRNPQHTRWRTTDDGVTLAVVEHYETTVLEARYAFARYPRIETICKNRRPNDPVQVDDVWVGRFRCLMVEDTPLFNVGGQGEYAGVAPHLYPTIPYVIMPFRELGFDEIGRRYQGLFSGTHALYPIESNVVSMHVWQLAWNAWRTWYGWFADGRELDVEPGTFITVNRNKGEYVDMLRGEAVPPELMQTANMIDALLQRNGTAQGPRTADGTRSAQQVWAIQSLRALKLEPARNNFQRGVARMLMLAQMIHEKMVKEDIILPVPGKNAEGEDYGEVRVRATDHAGYYDGWQISFGQRIDPAVLEQAKALQGLAGTNWMPLKKSWELSGLCEVPQEWQDMLIEQATDNLPFIMEQTALERTATFYGEDNPKYLALAQKVQESQAQQPQGPGVPNPGVGQVPSGMPRAAPGSTGDADGMRAPAPEVGQPQGRPSGMSNPPAMPNGNVLQS